MHVPVQLGTLVEIGVDAGEQPRRYVWRYDDIRNVVEEEAEEHLVDMDWKSRQPKALRKRSYELAQERWVWKEERIVHGCGCMSIY